MGVVLGGIGSSKMVGVGSVVRVVGGLEFGWKFRRCMRGWVGLDRRREMVC